MELIIDESSKQNFPVSELEELKRHIYNSKASSTRKAYLSDWNIFVEWCDRSGEATPLPAIPITVALFLNSQDKQGFAPSTLNRRLAAIKLAHEAKGFDSPAKSRLVRETLSGIRRKSSTLSVRKEPMTASKMVRLLEAVPSNTTMGIRDRAILLIGFGGALRRSEIVNFKAADIREEPEGLRVFIKRSKTDQEGVGQEITIPREVTSSEYCPVVALNNWLVVSSIKTGFLFRSINKGGVINHRRNRLRPRTICLIIKKYVKLVKMDPDNFGGHSLRSGWITSAAENGASVFKLKEVSRHKSLTVLSSYVRRVNLFKDHAGSGLIPSKNRFTTRSEA